MKIILTADVKGIGQKGEEKEVKPGFARNFLLPKGLAVISGSELANSLKESKDKAEEIEHQQSAKIAEVINKNIDLKLSFQKKASKEGKLFGSLSAKEIITEAEKEIGIKIASISPSNGVKEIGDHKLNLVFSDHQNLEIIISVNPIVDKKAR